MAILDYALKRLRLLVNELEDVDAAAPNNNDVLVYKSLSGNWEAEAQSGGSGSSNVYNYTSVTGNYTLTDSDTALGVDAAANTVITLPTAVGRTGQFFVVKRLPADIGTYSVTIDTTGAETIDGNDEINLPVLTSLTLMSTNVEWVII